MPESYWCYEHKCYHPDFYSECKKTQAEAEKVIQAVEECVLKPSPHKECKCRIALDQALTKAKQEKALTWFKTPNPLLGNVSPIDMIRSGRSDKLCKWIDQTIREGEEK
ncbi:hypothetical protein LCGC14_2960180 [marine sediment metagenome]|uniref:Antitoxin Xre/MbcA/ParS-like toxin-binding domain-containing protein n=1 Tax=marine sediment metagenome TaxID=412755 RepID=A0A0F8XDB6_9ZZZZ